MPKDLAGLGAARYANVRSPLQSGGALVAFVDVRPAWLFIDLDGTLADSLRAAVAAYERFAAGAGFSPSETEFEALIGPSIPEIVEVLRARHSLAGREADLVKLYRESWDICQEQVPTKRGALDLLRDATAHQTRTAVVTSGPQLATMRFLARTGLIEHVSMVISGDDVARSKPAPEIYSVALVKAGCSRSDAIALEDSVNGVRSASSAGITTVGLSDGSAFAVTAEALLAAGASRVIARLTDLFAD